MGLLIVQKYGGSSVADAEKIKNVARRVAESARLGHRMVVVVSAMGKTTDGLLSLAAAITATPDPREMDMILSTGEQVTIGLLAMALQSLGHPACSFTGPQIGMVTDAGHTRARIKRITAERIHAALDAGRVAVIAGFQGTTEGGDITTLGRGGSDLTGVALAAALKADVCEIFTDVDGVYTADPNVVPDARKLPRISYDEMLEMAALGAKVLQSRSVEFAKKYNVPVHVRSTFKPDPGTLVTREDHSMEDVVVTGITHDRGQAKVSILRVPDRPGIASRVFGGLGAQNIVVDMIVQNISRDGLTDISFTLPRADRDPRGDGAGRAGPRDRGGGRHRGRPGGQGLRGGRGHAQPRGRRGPHVRDPVRRGHQHPDDLHLRDRGLLRHRGQVHRAGGARAARRLRARRRAGRLTVAATARAAVFFGPGKPFEIRPVPIPEVEPEGVLIRVSHANICGSDLHFWRGDAPLRLPDDGWIFGHEMTGRVARLGAKIKTDSLGRPLKEGDRVAYTYFYPCGRCYACLHQEPAACPNKLERPLGPSAFPHLHGAFADHYYLRPRGADLRGAGFAVRRGGGAA